MNETNVGKTSTLTLSGISVIFDWGGKDRGKSAGHHHQADIVDLYGRRLQEELEEDDVRTYFIDSRRVTTREAQLKELQAGYIPMFLSCGWQDGKPKTNNCSLVEFSHPDLYRMSERICEAMTEWGRCYVFGHRVSRPVLVDLDYPMIRVTPFYLNGQHVDEYVQRLDGLAVGIGRAIGGYLRERGEGLRR